MGHGWSICCFYLDGRAYEIAVTHIFDDPIKDCIDALSSIIKGAKTSRFIWYDEPGGHQVIMNEVTGQTQNVRLSVQAFKETYGQEIKILESDEQDDIVFEISKVQLIRMFYYDFKKINELMKDKIFESNRKGKFPFRKFHEFERAALVYID